MKKAVLILLFACLVLGNMFAQETNKPSQPIRHGFVLGVDNDTLKYLVASPFDNWYISVGGGVQTLIGNEIEKDARFNKANCNLYAEVGKWLIPDMAVSLYFRFFDVSGQSKYGEQPFIDYNQLIATNVYQPYHAHGFILNGYVTLDWVNFLYGYERGCQKRFHVMTPIGLGYARMFGKQINQNPKIPRLHPYGVGDSRYNGELNAYCGLLFQYAVTPNFDLDFNASIFGTHGHWDWSPYSSNNPKKFDFVPAATIGLRFNLLKYVDKYDVRKQERERVPVNHVFLTIDGYQGNVIRDLESQIAELRDRMNLLDYAAANGNNIFVDDNGDPIIDGTNYSLDNEGNLIGKDGKPITDGTHIDSNGDLVDKDGRLIGKDGKPVITGVHVDQNGDVVDGNGKPVHGAIHRDNKGQIVDENGNPISDGIHFDNNGNLVDKNGHKLTNGIHLDDKGYVVDRDGKPVDKNGNRLGGGIHLYNPYSGLYNGAGSRVLVDDNDMPVADNDGYHLDADGNLVDKEGNPASGGIHLDATGNLVDKDGQPLDKDGKPAVKGVHPNSAGNLVDRDGNPVHGGIHRNDAGQIVDEAGNPVADGIHFDKNGSLVDKNGYRITNGIHLDDEGYVVDRHGNPVDKNGYKLGSGVHLYNPVEKMNQMRDQIDSLETRLNEEVDKNKDLERSLKDLNNPMADMLAANVGQDLPAEIVYFPLDKWTLDYNAYTKIVNFAKVINNSPDSVKFCIIGAADDKTGTVQRNILLSRERSNAIYRVLTEECGVNPDKLILYRLGGIYEYEPKELNRFCIMAAVNHKLTEVINKYPQY